ncbi:PREDICTED: uncharacterized protein LOC108368182 [Rhagoletis zephyria]|uniref:uncharacterized protein LOC108368182 n=1 Tax=Rhagoletis zephyria TaxID=28612 RepID=UPI000811A4A9|nr:PREDICTED: uncharacterized protein LOC108368182 [Rhagoletis zephyria]
MPVTRSGTSTDNSAREGDGDNYDELEATVVEQIPTNQTVQPSVETRLAEILQQVQNLQEELRQTRQVQANTVGAGDSYGIITAASSETGRSQTILPEFDGRPEDWPMFKETFIMTTTEYQYSDTQNMMRLQKAIKGKARETIECLLIHSRNVKQIIKTLEERYGKPELLVKSQLKKIRSVAPISENHIDQSVMFATKVQNLSSFLQAADCEYHLSNPTLMEELLIKLPMQRRIEWARHASTIVPRPTICHFSDWLQELSKIVNSACVYSSLEPRQPRTEGRPRGLPSALNPADFGTRPRDRKRESFWLTGPKFLKEEDKKLATERNMRRYQCGTSK